MLHLLGDLSRTGSIDGDVLEIGSFRGKTTVFLSAAIDALNLEKIVYSIDPYTETSSERGCSSEDIERAHETFVQATEGLKNHEHYRMYSDRAAVGLRNCSFSLIFVDGDHTYSGVMSDYHNFEPLLSSGGFMVFDDYRNPSWPGVGRAVDTIIDEGVLSVERRMMKTIHLRKR